MPETLEDVERKIADLEDDIKQTKTDLRTCAAEEKAALNALLVSYNQQLASLREDKKRLIEGAASGDKSNEFLLIKKRKSIEEAKRAKDTCPAFYDETVLVAEQLADVKEENTALMRQIISLNEQILSLDRTKAQFEKERATVFRDACVLYKRGIVELQLSLFMDSHGGTHYEFYCGRDVIPKTFKDAMHHWCSCPLHEVHILNSYKEDRVNLALYAEKEAVKNSLFYLYDTISSLLHFNAGEEYPIRVVPFAKPADTLAFMTFLQHYSISMFLASVHPVPAFDSNTHTPVPVQGAVKDAEVAK